MSMRRRIACFFGFHDWRRSKFVALNRRVAPLVCRHCWTHKKGSDE